MWGILFDDGTLANVEGRVTVYPDFAAARTQATYWNHDGEPHGWPYCHPVPLPVQS